MNVRKLLRPAALILALGLGACASLAGATGPSALGLVKSVDVESAAAGVADSDAAAIQSGLYQILVEKPQGVEAAPKAQAVKVKILQFHVPQPGMLVPQAPSQARLRVTITGDGGAVIADDTVWARVLIPEDKDYPNSEELAEEIVLSVTRYVTRTLG